ncbi:MAG: BON domain-containing protein [Gemmataceae bacterium]
MPRLKSPNLAPERCAELARHILDRTGRRVHGLCVEVRNERVVLRGRASSYYVKQLAQHCVWDVLPQAQLENGIVVD